MADRPAQVSDSDRLFLRQTERPDFEHGRHRLRVVDLFAGAGGLTLGMALGCRKGGWGIDIPLAVEMDSSAVAVYSHNFPTATVWQTPVEAVFDGAPGQRATPSERRALRQAGPVDILLGGPPCQGNSDLNNRTRRVDLRNRAYALMGRAAEVLRPRFIIIENVPGILHDRFKTLTETEGILRDLGYATLSRVVHMEAAGVPQLRTRHFLLAGTDERVLEVALDFGRGNTPRSVAWAIRDLLAAEGVSPFDSSSRASSRNQDRMDWLLQNDAFDLPNKMRPACHHGAHSYNSMYGRLRWGYPAQTITSGYGSAGQGRYVHPSRARTLTPHEAARLQGFPDWFDFTAGGRVARRGAWATLIGNAVPPMLGVRIGEALFRITNASNSGVQTADAVRMRRVRRAGTGVELALRAELTRRHLRFEVDARIPGIRGRPDMVFHDERVAVYVDGCFWHSCPAHGTYPASNAAWWRDKLAANRDRDERHESELRSEGWTVIRIWEHEDPSEVAERVERVLGAPR